MIIFSKLRFKRVKDYLQDYPRPCDHPVICRVRLENLQVLCTNCKRQMPLGEMLRDDAKNIERVLESLKNL